MRVTVRRIPALHIATRSRRHVPIPLIDVSSRMIAAAIR